MRIAYALSLIFLSGASCVFLFKIRKENGLSSYLRGILICAVIGMLACIVSSYSQSETLSLIAFGVYFSALFWLLFFFVGFVLAYTNNHSRAAMAVVFAIAVITSANCLLNIRYRHVFDVSELIWVTDNNRYLILVPQLWYKIHLVSGFVVTAVCVIILIVKTIETPSAYRPRYLVILFMIFITISLNTAFLVFRLPMDWSALFYAAFVIIAWFFSTRYIKTFLLSKTLAVIVDRMDTGLVIYDYTDRPVYLNERGLEMLGTDINGLSKLLTKWYETEKVSTLKSGEREIEFSKHGQKYVYRIRFEELMDAEGVYNGGFFALHDITKDKEREAVEQYNNRHDRLTNLYNQEAFLEECKKLLDEDVYGQYVMIRTETEAFTAIRSIYGRETRNAIIAGLGGIIKRKCYGKAIGGWMNDDSFGIMMPVSEFTEKEMVDEVSELFSEILGENARTFHLQVGISQINDRGSSARAFAEQARVALDYISDKENTVVSWYTEGMRRKGIMDSNLTSALPNAIRSGELRIYLQPVLDTKDKMIGAEALVRWHKDGKVLLPGEFLPLLEKYELIAKVDLFVWQQAAKQLKKWQEEGRNDLFITVNIARKDLYLLDVCNELSRIVKEYGVDAKNLHIDISSETLFLEKNHLISIVRTLREAGFKVNLDNFGGVYTAPVFLKDIKFDGIKITKELVYGLESDAEGKILTSGLVELGKKLDVQVYAEGIETEREHKALKAMDCFGYQGFFISEPLPLEQFEASYF